MILAQAFRSAEAMSLLVAGLRDSDKLLLSQTLSAVHSLAIDDDIRKEVHTLPNDDIGYNSFSLSSKVVSPRSLPV